MTLAAERQNFILDQLSREGRVLATEIATRFKISEDSARRDLRDLAEAGLCRRVYGGALPLAPALLPLAMRETDRPESKAAVARTAAGLLAELVPTRGLLFLDVGSTNAAVARALPTGLAITVATHAPGIAASLVGRPGLELLLLGGRVDPFIGAALGAHTLRAVERLRPDVALIGLCAIHAEAGLAAADAEDAEIKRAVAAGAGRLVAAATGDRLGSRAPFLVAPAATLSHLVTDAEALERETTALRALGVDVRIAAEAGR